MSKYKIPVYRAEIDDGLAVAIADDTSLSYLAEASPLAYDGLADDMRSAFAADHPSDQFDLYYMKDVLATTGWNKNRDIFDRLEMWSARHTADHKPFNIEHRPLEIIGHVANSRVFDEHMKEVDDDIPVEDIPDKFHIVNGSVLYTHLQDEERKKFMEQTIAEIRAGEWYVSMECLFRGFDYGVVRPDGSQHVLPRSEETAFLTKHLAQYGGTGSYKCPDTGDEFTLGRVLKNITFSGKGLVRKPANPQSVIFNSVSSFLPSPTNLVYLTVGSHSSSKNQTENIHMPDTNSAEQALRDQNARLEKQVESLQSEVAGLKSKGTEATIADLQAGLRAKDATIADLDKSVASLTAQVAAIEESSKAIKTRAEGAEASLKAATDALAALKAVETKRARTDILKGKHAPEAVVAGLVEQLAVLDDDAFSKTVETISASWKQPEPPAPKPEKGKKDPVVDAIDKAEVDPDPALGTQQEDKLEASRAAVLDFMGKSLKQARGGRPSVLSAAEEN